MISPKLMKRERVRAYLYLWTDSEGFLPQSVSDSPGFWPSAGYPRYGAQMDRKDAPKMLDCGDFRVPSGRVVLVSGTRGIN